MSGYGEVQRQWRGQSGLEQPVYLCPDRHGGTVVTTAINGTSSSSNTLTGGDASATVDGNLGSYLYVSGVSSATANVTGNVGNYVQVNATGYDSTNTHTESFSFTPDANSPRTGTATAQEYQSYTSTPSAAGGDAVANVSGTVGSTSRPAQRPAMPPSI